MDDFDSKFNCFSYLYGCAESRENEKIYLKRAVENMPEEDKKQIRIHLFGMIASLK